MYKHIIEVYALEWFDKVNGNSYFAGRVLFDDQEFIMPFEYGYGNYYEQAALAVLKEACFIPYDAATLRSHCDYNNIKLISVKHENCKKRELKEFKA